MYENAFNLLSEPINLLLLGSAGDLLSDMDLLDDKVRVVAIDAQSPGINASCRTDLIQSVVTPHGGGPVEFIYRSFSPCSGMLEADERQIEAFGLEGYYKIIRKQQMGNTLPVGEIAGQFGIKHWDLIKTDLEGLDFRILAALAEKELPFTSVIKMETRIIPLYHTEEPLDLVIGRLRQLGFVLFDLESEKWLYKTALKAPRNGRIAFSNAIFVNQNLCREPEQLVRRVLTLGISGFSNMAAFMLDYPNSCKLPDIVRSELLDFLNAVDSRKAARIVNPAFPHVV